MEQAILIVGHVALDHVGGAVRLGGAASFAARAALALGLRPHVVTSAPPDFALLGELAGPGLALQVKPSAAPTTFELDYSGPVRRVRQLARAADLTVDDVPVAWRAAPLAYIAPVCGECDAALVESLPPASAVVGAQGWLRAVDPDGRVVPALAPAALDPPGGMLAVVFSELDHPDAERLAERFAARARVVAVTRGACGATLWHDGAREEVPAAPAAEVDPTGAGDVFGLVLGLALGRGALPRRAAELAALAAARVVEGPGIGRLASFDWPSPPPAR